MITRKTVLILGAGASVPYGFPTGWQLRQQILNKLDNQESKLSQFLLSEQYVSDFEKLLAFRLAFLRSGAYSIDTFLENRPTEDQKLGKVIIAHELISCEREDRLFRKNKLDAFNNPSAEAVGKFGEEKKWYPYLLNKLNSSLAEFVDNQLTVITFNYDRSFEYYLWLALQKKYALLEYQATDLVKSIPIIHVHGKLGEPHFLKANGRKYETEIDRESITKATLKLKIISETDDSVSEFQPTKEKIKKEIAQASTIFFLGCGYHQENLERLSIHSLLSENILDHQKYIIGTAFGIKGADRTQIQLAFSVTGSAKDSLIKLGDREIESLEFLEETYIFW